MRIFFLMAIAVISSVIMYGCSDNSTDPANSAPKIIISKAEIIKDDNMDGKINPGETVLFNLILKNVGGKIANGLEINSIYMINGDERISLYSPELIYGSLMPGAEGLPVNDINKYSFKLIVQSDAIADFVYRFEFYIYGEGIRLWKDTLSFKIEKSGALMKVSKIEVSEDPNKNGKANPGESLGMKAYIKNVGTSGDKVYIKNVELLKDNGEVRVEDYDCSEEMYIPAGEERKTEFGFHLNIDTTTPPKSILKYRIQMINDQGAFWDDTVKLFIDRSDVNVKLTKVEITNEDDQQLKRMLWGQIKVCLKNLGNDIARDVIIENVTTSPQVLVGGCFFERYGNIAPGQETCQPIDKHYAFEIHIDLDDPVTDKLKVNMFLKDGEGNRWVESFELEVEP